VQALDVAPLRSPAAADAASEFMLLLVVRVDFLSLFFVRRVEAAGLPPSTY
jgi:hypothetical protein